MLGILKVERKKRETTFVYEKECAMCLFQRFGLRETKHVCSYFNLKILKIGKNVTLFRGKRC